MNKTEQIPNPRCFAAITIHSLHINQRATFPRWPWA